MKGLLKKVFALFLSFIMMVPFIPNALAAASYNPNAAVEYAKKTLERWKWALRRVCL